MIHFDYNGNLCGKKGGTNTTFVKDITCKLCLQDLEELQEDVGAGNGYN